MSEDGSVQSWQSGLAGPSCLVNEELLATTASKESSSNCSKGVDDDYLSCSDLMSVSEGDALDIETANDDCVYVEENPSQDRPFDGELVVDRLLQRVLTERMFELRRIRHGDRPVTGSRSRETLDNFFSRALGSSTPADAEEHRPDSVRDEVQLLSRSGVVRSVLGSGSLRQSMERALMGRAPTSSAETRIPRGRETGTQRNRIVRTPENLNSTQSPLASTSHIEQSRNEMTADEAHFNAMLDTGMQLLAESVSSDIDSLQDLRIVTSVLDGTFRRDLEQLVQDRVSQAGGGRQVADFIASLPRTAIRQPRRQSSTLSEASLPQRTNLPSYGQVAADLRKLQSEVSDMKHMLGLTFEIQMDTQRAIRQEVSAVFTAFMDQYLKQQSGETAANTSSSGQQPKRTQPVSGGACAVCLEKSVDTILYKCGHLCVCHTCGLQLKMKGHHCPICRAPILDVMRAYQTQ